MDFMSSGPLNSRMISLVESTAGGFSAEADIWMLAFAVNGWGSEEEEHPQTSKRPAHINGSSRLLALYARAVPVMNIMLSEASLLVKQLPQKCPFCV
jgi:hypothetical protein